MLASGLRRAAIAIAALAAYVTLLTGAASARVTLEFATPQTPEDAAVLETLNAQGWLVPIKAQLDAFKLKRPIAVRLRSCTGWGGAWYEGNMVTVCYRYIGNVMRHARREDRPAWVSEEQAIAGGVVDIFFHEFAHALFDQFAIPILGREEDAADQVAAYMMLMRGGDEAAGLIKGTAYLYLRWMRDFGDGARHGGRTLSTGARAYAAEPHASSAQRFYNILCLAYGADEDRFAQLVRDTDLPEDRADGCEDEWVLIDKAWKKLVLPLIDERLAKQAKAKSLLRPFSKVGG